MTALVIPTGGRLGRARDLEVTERFGMLLGMLMDLRRLAARVSSRQAANAVQSFSALLLALVKREQLNASGALFDRYHFAIFTFVVLADELMANSLPTEGAVAWHKRSLEKRLFGTDLGIVGLHALADAIIERTVKKDAAFRAGLILRALSLIPPDADLVEEAWECDRRKRALRRITSSPCEVREPVLVPQPPRRRRGFGAAVAFLLSCVGLAVVSDAIWLAVRSEVAAVIVERP